MFSTFVKLFSKLSLSLRAKYKYTFMEYHYRHYRHHLYIHSRLFLANDDPVTGVQVTDHCRPKRPPDATVLVIPFIHQFLTLWGGEEGTPCMLHMWRNSSGHPPDPNLAEHHPNEMEY